MKKRQKRKCGKREDAVGAAVRAWKLGTSESRAESQTAGPGVCQPPLGRGESRQPLARGCVYHKFWPQPNYTCSPIPAHFGDVEQVGQLSRHHGSLGSCSRPSRRLPTIQPRSCLSRHRETSSCHESPRGHPRLRTGHRLLEGHAPSRNAIRGSSQRSEDSEWPLRPASEPLFHVSETTFPCKGASIAMKERTGLQATPVYEPW